ncbi:hypothetical protein [Azospirillum halopraeferens]|uniref:hypothetical protein n=1 Tax=Azospirillum halopraeferens TaxID=34010 RepID=UPI00041D7435|nr:hypothetical protein [Azospirillum halopraeferens]
MRSRFWLAALPAVLLGVAACDNQVAEAPAPADDPSMAEQPMTTTPPADDPAMGGPATTPPPAPQ